MVTGCRLLIHPTGFGPISSSGTAIELDFGVESFLSRKGEVTPAKFLRVGRGYSRTAALCHLRVGFLNSASPSRSETRGLSQNN